MTSSGPARARLLSVAVALLAALLLVPGSGAAGPAPAAAAAERRATCTLPAAGFKPAKVQIPSVGRTMRAVTVRRTRSGAVGTPPTTRAGKWLVGWDPQTRPGSGEGSVITVAHTWPDGSALGNALLRKTRRGATIVVTGASGQRICYRVTQRASYRADRVPRSKAFRPWGPEQMVIVVCSGKRLGPGRWTHRTIWYAKPVIS